MKLFVIAALIAVSAAARLEHLEQQQKLRAYLPPNQGSTFGSHGSFGDASDSETVFSARGAFPSASNQYLPPDQGPSASAGSPQFAGSVNGFGAQHLRTQQFAQTYQAAPAQYGHQDASPQATNFGAQARYQPQPAAASRQYLAPHSSQNIPQQPFDDQTGYHY